MTHTKEHLYECARLAGERLYGDSRSGLLWGSSTPDDVSFVHERTSDRLKQLVSQIGEDALDPNEFLVTTWEFAFFPSDLGKGLDASDTMSLLSDIEALADVDDLIYLCDNTDGTTISVLTPDIADEDDYRAIVQAALDREEQT